jgi:hypothetical protein
MPKLHTKDMFGTRKYWAVGIAVSLVVAFILLQPLQIWTEETGAVSSIPPDIESEDIVTSSIPTVDNCVLQFGLQPDDPVDMNTMISGTTIKTIHAEKEVFTCQQASGAPVIFDVTISTKIFEDLKEQRTVKRSFEVITCAKNVDGTVMGCQTTVPSTTLPLARNCLPYSLTHEQFLIEMNSVVGIGALSNMAKTVDAEKEIFRCELSQGVPAKIKDVTIFSEIYEDMNTRTTLKTNFDSDLREGYKYCKCSRL